MMQTRVPMRHLAATDSDDTTYQNCVGLVCLTAGNAVVQDRAGTSVTYPLTAGQRLDFAVYKLMAASTGTYSLLF